MGASRHFSIWSTGVLIALSSALQAQDAANSAVQQAQNFAQRPGANSSSTVERMFLPGGVPVAEGVSDQDLGEQWMFKPNARQTRFTAFADFSGFYTSNVALAHGNGRGDSFLVANAGIGYAQPFGGGWSWNAGIVESLFRYNRFSEFDFDSFTVNGGISVQAHQLWGVNFSLQYGYNFLARGGTSDELFHSHSFTLAGVKTWRLSSADSFSFGSSVGISLAHPSDLQRADFDLFAGYRLNITRSLTASVDYRAGFFDYTNSSRRDVDQTLTVGLVFAINRWLSVSASASGGYNSSNRSAFEYRVLNLGGGIAGNIRF